MILQARMLRAWFAAIQSLARAPRPGPLKGGLSTPSSSPGARRASVATFALRTGVFSFVLGARRASVAACPGVHNSTQSPRAPCAHIFCCSLGPRCADVATPTLRAGANFLLFSYFLGPVAPSSLRSPSLLGASSPLQLHPYRQCLVNLRHCQQG